MTNHELLQPQSGKLSCQNLSRGNRGEERRKRAVFCAVRCHQPHARRTITLIAARRLGERGPRASANARSDVQAVIASPPAFLVRCPTPASAPTLHPMPALKNQRHERFAQEIAAGKTGDEAYTAAGYAKNRHNAARLKATEPVRKRITELLNTREQKTLQTSERAVQAASLSKAWVLEGLIENAAIALGRRTVKATVKLPKSAETAEVEVTARDPAAANRALELLGKELGMFIDRRESGRPGEFTEAQTPRDVIEAVRQELGDGVADLLAGLVAAAPSTEQQLQPNAEGSEAVN